MLQSVSLHWVRGPPPLPPPPPQSATVLLTEPGPTERWERASPRIRCPAALRSSDAHSYFLRKHLLPSMLPEYSDTWRKVGEPIILCPQTHRSLHYDHVSTPAVSIYFNKELLSAPIRLHFIYRIPCPKLCQEMIFLLTGLPVEKMNTVLFQSPRLFKAVVTFPTASSIRDTIPA